MKIQTYFVFVAFSLMVLLSMNVSLSHVSEETRISSSEFETLATSEFDAAFAELGFLLDFSLDREEAEKLVGNHYRQNTALLDILKRIFSNEVTLSNIVYASGSQWKLLRVLLSEFLGLFDATEGFNEEYNEMALQRFHDSKVRIGNLIQYFYEISGSVQDGGFLLNDDRKKMINSAISGLLRTLEMALRECTERVENILEYHHKRKHGLGKPLSCWRRTDDAINSFVSQEGSHLNVLLPVFLLASTVLGVHKFFGASVPEATAYATIMLAFVYILVYLIEHIYFEKFDQIQPSQVSLDELKKMLQCNIEFLNESFQLGNENVSLLSTQEHTST